MTIKKLAKIFKSKHKQLYISAFAITKNSEMAEDAVHDALLSVAQTNSLIMDLQSYLFMSVRNKALSKICYSKKHMPLTEEFFQTEAFSTEQQVFATNLFQQLLKLNANHQQVIVMKVFAEMTFKEIALITDSPINTVSSWYRRGINQLKEKLDEKQF